MDDVEPPASPRLSNERVDVEGSQEDSDELTSEEIHTNQSRSPISDEPGEPLVSVERPVIDEEPVDLPVDRPVIGEEPYALQNDQEEEKVEGQTPKDKDPVEEIKIPAKEIEAAASTSTTPSKEEKTIIDTSAPIESVLDAVSKFGGTVNRKAHKSQPPEKSRITEEELEKAKVEIPVLIQQTEAAEEAKAHALKELEATHRLIEELKLKLERAQAEERKAKKDSELAKLRLKEMQEGGEEDLNSVEEVEALRRKCSSLLCEKNAAVKKAKEDLFTSKEIEKTAEEMSLELASAKEALESVYAARLEAEEQRNRAAMSRAREAMQRDKEMQQEEEVMAKLRRQVEAEQDLKAQLKTASELLASLKTELEDYKELKRRRVDERIGESDKKANDDEAKNRLEELKLKAEKTRDEMRCLKAVFETLNKELKHEKSELASVKQREGMVWPGVVSLKAELEKMNAVIAAVRIREREAKKRMEEMPKKLEVAAKEVNEAKSGAEAAREGLRRVKEEAKQAKERSSPAESRLVEVQREIEAARASEEQALVAIKAFVETEVCGEPPDQEVVALEEYNELSKRAQEAEEQANAKAEATMAQVESAREAEMETLRKLEEANEELVTRKEVYAHAAKKAEKENEAKKAAEQELARWRAENGHRLKDDNGAADSPGESIEEGQDKHTAPPPIHTGNKDSKDSSPSGSPRLSSPDMKAAKKKKRHYFPRIFTLFSKKKTS